ncbi:hypothetical protein SNEBB_010215 [Seison nebaliae]|nr:hypothetical protein SNEBB_010215 [Seison nebaliae]
MPAYHATNRESPLIGNIAILPLRTKFRGPAPRLTDEEDIIDETIYYFKPNSFFKNFEIKSPSDRVLIYVTFYIQECLKKLLKSSSKIEGSKELNTLAVSQFALPGDVQFPLNDFYKKPTNENDRETMKQYFLQLRQETGLRILEKVFPESTNGQPCKWWLCFAERMFMNKALSGMVNVN